MGMLAWVMMGLAIWHFTIFLPDRFWGGIVGAFLGALIGAVLFGLHRQRLHDPRASATPTCSPRSRPIPGALIGIAVVYFEGVRRGQRGAGAVALRRDATAPASSLLAGVRCVELCGRAPQERPAPPAPVDPEAAEHPERPQAVAHAASRSDARRLEEVARRDRDLDHARVAGHDLGEDLLVEHEAVGVAQERDRAQEVGRRRRGSPCGTRRSATPKARFSIPVSRRLPTHFQRGMPPAIARSSSSREPITTSASPSRIGCDHLGHERRVVLVVGVDHHDDVGAVEQRPRVAGLLVRRRSRGWRGGGARRSRCASATAVVSSGLASSTSSARSAALTGISAATAGIVRAAL